MRRSFLLSLVLLIATFFIVGAIQSRGVPKVVATNLESIPKQIGNYIGTEDYFDQSVYEELNADLHLYRHYRSPDGHQIDLYIGYYGTAKGGRTPHNPYACLPSSGWALVHTGFQSLRFPSKASRVKVNFIIAQKGTLSDSVLHWYQSAGSTVLNTGIEQNIQRFVGRLWYNRNDGAFIRVSSISSKPPDGSIDERIIVFAEMVLDLLPQYWPDEK